MNIDISEAMSSWRQGRDHRQRSRGRRARWLPTFHGFDKQMVLAIGKVLFQYQEAAVFAETRRGR
jgi:hypothetical protein